MEAEDESGTQRNAGDFDIAGQRRKVATTRSMLTSTKTGEPPSSDFSDSSPPTSASNFKDSSKRLSEGANADHAFSPSPSSSYLPTKEKAIKTHPDANTHTEAVEPGRLNELKRFTLWETKTKFYLVAYNTSQTRFRILKVDRMPERKVLTSEDAPQETHREGESASKSDAFSHTNNAPSTRLPASQQAEEIKSNSMRWNLNVTTDRVVYSRSQIAKLLDMISEGNKSSGGLKEIGRFFGIVGFIRFTCAYYMVLISRRSVVGLLGGHYLYHCDETRILPVCHASVLANLPGRTKLLDQEEARLLHTFKQVDLSKNFYFSYTYDLTKTLQDNLTSDGGKRTKDATAWGYNEKFVWNHHLLLPAFASSRNLSGPSDADAASGEWVLPLIYGFVDQAKLCVLNCTIHVTLIARRSRHFAGARFLKRGTDENGHVANDVETEQIVSEALTTPFYAPRRERNLGQEGERRGANPRYTSYVMHRGSIPIYWTQDSTNMSPRPPIEISVVDPYYSSAALHFDDMLRRYGYPIIVLNLIKSKEKQPREGKLLGAFGECVSYLNQFLPADKKLRYIAWDMSRASKSRDQDVIGVLEDIAEETVNATKFFHSGSEPNSFCTGSDGKGRRETILLQSGVVRVNCVDCLDRTNAAQFVIGKAAFGHQLHALGLLNNPSLPFDSAAVDMLTEMYHDLGDTVALQYGGSHLVNTMETYRKINQWTSHSRDMLEGLKRYYANSFVDAEKQAAINLFLGVDAEQPDASRRTSLVRPRRHYQQWYTPEFLEPRGDISNSEERLLDIVNEKSSFWAEYYRPSLFTDLLRHHAFKMTAVHQHSSTIPAVSVAYPMSPSIPVMSLHRRVAGGGVPSSPRTTSKALTQIPHSAGTAMVLTSPFTSRNNASLVNGLRPKDGAMAPGSPSRPPKALIGGARRWISLNRGEEETQPRRVSENAATMRKKSLKITDAEAEAIKALSSPSESAWPTWEEITGAQTLAPSTEVILEGLLNPSVSAEEAKEYAWWLNQFRDVAFDAGLPSSIPEPAALMPAAAGIIGGGAPLYQIGVRRPATQKQRQQIAETDALLYDFEVALSNGYPSALEKIFSHDVEEAVKADPALLNYPLAANALLSVASEKKVRAFSHWITGPNHNKPLLSTTV